MIGIEPSSVGQAVILSRSKCGARLCSFLETIAEIEDIELAMPNKHCLLVDLSRFGQDNPNEIFVPTDEPHGYIEARIVRKS